MRVREFALPARVEEEEKDHRTVSAVILRSKRARKSFTQVGTLSGVQDGGTGTPLNKNLKIGAAIFVSS